MFDVGVYQNAIIDVTEHPNAATAEHLKCGHFG
jgi:hypothetical protein